MKYILINSNGDWSIENVKRGSVAESRLVERLALHICGHGLVCNTPNYLVESILEYSSYTFQHMLTQSLQYTVSRSLLGILIDGHYDIHFMFHG